MSVSENQITLGVSHDSQSNAAKELQVSNEYIEIKEIKEKNEFEKLNDPNDRSPVKIDLPALPNDNRSYRFLRLENGLKLLLIHHPIKVMSKALLRVAAGSFDEPDEFPGLAHFLEHMLFMGSEKYPDENEYHRYISEHSGDYNANTDDEHTNFHFEIENEHFEPALDQLAQFFIAPLLKAECAEREVQAVDNEFEGSKEQDLLRIAYVLKKSVNPKHPDSRFDCGNFDTLNDIEHVLPALKQFYDKYYKADNMTLIFESKYSLDEQETIAKKYFSLVPSMKEACKRSPVPQFLPDAFQVKYSMESIQHHNVFGMSYLFSGKRSLENEAALKYIVSLLSNPSPGGLFDYLKNQRFVTNVSGEISFSVDCDFDDDEQKFDLTIILPLTKTGLTRTDEIVKATLDYVYFLKKNGIDEKFFKELQTINENQFRFKSYQLRTPEDFMDNLEDYPLDRFFLGGSITKETPFPKQRIQEILAAFSPKNLQQFVIQDCEIVGESETEAYTGAKFKREPASASINHWSEPGETDLLPFSLPEQSPYIPENFNHIVRIARVIFKDDTSQYQTSSSC